jgi:predicted nucleic acid-binding protein
MCASVAVQCAHPQFAATSALLRRLLAAGDDLCVCDIVITKVFGGLAPHEISATRRFLQSLTYLERSRTAAESAGQWRYAFARRGIQVTLPDALIAATAVEHGATLVTGNARRFPMQRVSILPLPRS